MRRWMVDILLSNTFVQTYNGAKKSQFIKEKPILRSTLMQITRILKKNTVNTLQRKGCQYDLY